MNGYEYELACAEYLRKKGFRDVSVTQASRDQGADIIAFRKKEKCAVQCKYYQSPVGNKAVQEVYAAATYYGCDRAIVMTNSTFTKGAIELAESLQVELMPGVDFTRRRFGPVDVLLLLVILLLFGMECVIALQPDLPEQLSFLSDLPADLKNPVLFAGIGCLVLFLVRRITYKPYRVREIRESAKVPTDSSSEKAAQGDSPDATTTPQESFSVEEYSVLYDLINIAEQSFHESDDEDERESIRETLESAYSVLIAHEAELPEEWDSPSERLEQLRSEEL
ncbi:MAG: restriction endonuclease [Lachnospiraceae bacterium]|nr:restriction endonuclease [Lachnospiraceae bacterium]